MVLYCVKANVLLRLDNSIDIDANCANICHSPRLSNIIENLEIMVAVLLANHM
jgi:hypothetical protein